ncbi:MAG: threonine synthase [Limnochordia bacterium]|jgi:threonine synthase|nr:threonine synthase [Bacillota bacterium]
MKHGEPWPGIIGRYGQYLPVTSDMPVVTLLEGNTPLVCARRLARQIGLRAELFIKNDALNPTGSFKDRGMTLMVSKALEGHAAGVICPSLGNASASAAAYAARAGMKCFALAPEEVVITGQMVQTQVYGAHVFAVRGSYDDCAAIAQEIAADNRLILVNSLNPYALHGQKTAAFEICDQLGQPPTYVALPVGDGGNITALWQGFKEYANHKNCAPRMLGFQGNGAAPFIAGQAIPKPRTVATAIRVGCPANWQGTLDAVEESGGLLEQVTDDEIVAAYQLVARLEGILLDLSGAAALAGLVKLSQQGFFKPGENVVLLATGHGLKDGYRPAIAEPSAVVYVESAAEVRRVLENVR